MAGSRAQSCGLVLASCTGDQRTPVIGLTFIDGIKRNGLAYEGGSILDPRTGSAYSASMDRSADGLQLSVRAFSASIFSAIPGYGGDLLEKCAAARALSIMRMDIRKKRLPAP
jgi:hypothetical protein